MESLIIIFIITKECKGGQWSVLKWLANAFYPKREKRRRKKRRHFIHSFATCWKDGKAFERVTKHKRKAGRRRDGAEEECDRIVKHTI